MNGTSAGRGLALKVRGHRREDVAVTLEFSVRPFARVPVNDDAADLLDAVGEALDRDPRALGLALGYDYDRQRVDAIFQVVPTPTRSIVDAVVVAAAVFDAALARAGVEARTSGVAVVEGDDPDELP